MPDDANGPAKPRWQRARILKSSAFPWAVGREIWVEAAPAIVRSVWNRDTLKISAVRGLLSNITADGGPLYAPSGAIELLGRSDADFANRVELLTWEQFEAGEQRLSG